MCRVELVILDLSWNFGLFCLTAWAVASPIARGNCPNANHTQPSSNTTDLSCKHPRQVFTFLFVDDLAGRAVLSVGALRAADPQLVVAEPRLEPGPLLDLGVDRPPLLQLLLPVVVVVVALGEER